MLLSALWHFLTCVDRFEHSEVFVTVLQLVESVFWTNFSTLNRCSHLCELQVASHEPAAYLKENQEKSVQEEDSVTIKGPASSSRRVEQGESESKPEKDKKMVKLRKAIGM